MPVDTLLEGRMPVDRYTTIYIYGRMPIDTLLEGVMPVDTLLKGMMPIDTLLEGRTALFERKLPIVLFL